MVRYGAGYLMVAADGGIFNFSDQAFLGSLGDNPPPKPHRLRRHPRLVDIHRPGGSMPNRLRHTILAGALLAGAVSFAGSGQGPAQATDGHAQAAGTAAAASPSGCWMVA